MHPRVYMHLIYSSPAEGLTCRCGIVWTGCPGLAAKELVAWDWRRPDRQAQLHLKPRRFEGCRSVCCSSTWDGRPARDGTVGQRLEGWVRAPQKGLVWALGQSRGPCSCTGVRRLWPLGGDHRGCVHGGVRAAPAQREPARG